MPFLTALHRSFSLVATEILINTERGQFPMLIGTCGSNVNRTNLTGASRPTVRACGTLPQYYYQPRQSQKPHNSCHGTLFANPVCHYPPPRPWWLHHKKRQHLHGFVSISTAYE